MRLSIITINLNNRDGLRKTIDSVVSQTFKNFEWIVIDGGSTDGSKELVEQYAGHFAYWVSEPDKGIYNAMNKGIKEAKGEYLLFLNSGDWLASSSVLEEVFNTDPNADIVYGDNFERDGSIGVSPKRLTLQRMYRSTICHQNVFHSKRLFETCQYDENYKIASDWKFLYEAIVRNKATYKKVDVIISGLQKEASYDGSRLPSERDMILKQLYSSIELEAFEEYLRMKESTWYPDLLFLESHKIFFRWVKRVVRLYKKLCKC